MTIKMGPLLRHDGRYLTNSLLFTSLNHDTTGLCCRWGNGNLWAAWLCAHPPPWSIVLDHPCCSAHPVDRGAGLNCWRKPQAGWNFLLSWIPNDSKQGSRSWQPFGVGKNAYKSFRQAQWRAFTIFATNSSFLAVTADLQIQFSIICNKYHVIMHFLPKKRCYCPKKALFCLKSFKKLIVHKSQPILISQQNHTWYLSFFYTSKIFGE